MKLTPAQSKALIYIGRHPRKEPKVGSKLSRYLLNKLKERGLVIEVDGIILLTTEGECAFAKVHLK